MDASSQLFWPALLLTLFVIIVASVITGKNKTCAHNTSALVVQNYNTTHQSNANTAKDEPGLTVKVQNYNTTHQSNANTAKDEPGLTGSSSDDDVDECTVDDSRRWGEVPAEEDIRNALKDYTLSPDAEEKPLRYMAGMLRASQLEKIMTKEELEEEQRVQRDQLAAIFQLLKDKQETFGDLTECDLEEQLKLYSF